MPGHDHLPLPLDLPRARLVPGALRARGAARAAGAARRAKNLESALLLRVHGRGERGRAPRDRRVDEAGHRRRPHPRAALRAVRSRAEHDRARQRQLAVLLGVSAPPARPGCATARTSSATRCATRSSAAPRSSSCSSPAATARPRPKDRLEMTRDEFVAAVETAHSRGAMIRGHIASKPGILMALDAGHGRDRPRRRPRRRVHRPRRRGRDVHRAEHLLPVGVPREDGRRRTRLHRLDQGRPRAHVRGAARRPTRRASSSSSATTTARSASRTAATPPSSRSTSATPGSPPSRSSAGRPRTAPS